MSVTLSSNFASLLLKKHVLMGKNLKQPRGKIKKKTPLYPV